MGGSRYSWAWQHFYTDGKRHGQNQSANNAWCKACLNAKIRELHHADIHGSTLGISVPRTNEELHTDACKLIPVKTGKPKQKLVPHLKTCQYVAEPVQVQATACLEENETSENTQPRTLARTASLPLLSVPSPAPILLASISGDIATDSPRFPLSPITPWISASSELPLAPEALLERPAKRLKLNWTCDLAQEFNEDFCAMLVATGSSWNFANNPRVHAFHEKWSGGAVVPDRQTLSGPVLDTLVKKVESGMAAKLSRKMATGQCDGWKNMAKQSVIASMVTVDSEAHLLRTHNVSSEAKTGEELLKLVLEDIEYAEKTFLLEVIGWCADDGGDARKMRWLLQTLKPWMIVILCWAHQCVPKALEVIKWFNAHSRGLGILNVKQQSINPNKILALILPVITRWTAHYCSLSQLLEVEGAMRASYNKYKVTLLACTGATADAKNKAIEIQDIVEDPSFWRDVRKVKEILEPLAVAANITQAPNTKLYHVLLTLGNLFRIYSDPRVDIEVQDGIHASLEKRWAKADQDVFIAAVVMNPYICDHCFAAGVQDLTRIGLFNIVNRVCERILREKTDTAFYSAFMDYLAQDHEFSAEWMRLDMIKSIADLEKSKVDVVKVWQGIDTSQPTGCNRLVCFAIGLLSIVANSAGCEQAFSQFGIIHTKRRCRLSLENVRKTSLLRMEMRRTDIAAGVGLKPRKRKFGNEDGESQDTGATVASAADIEWAAVVSDVESFEEMATRLTQDTEESVTLEEENVDPVEKDIEDTPASAIGIRLEPSPATARPSSSQNVPPVLPARPAASRRPGKTCIPLSALFRYPTSSEDKWDGMDYYWKGAVKNLDDEVQIHEDATQQFLDGEDDDE